MKVLRLWVFILLDGELSCHAAWISTIHKVALAVLVISEVRKFNFIEAQQSTEGHRGNEWLG